MAHSDPRALRPLGRGERRQSLNQEGLWGASLVVQWLRLSASTAKGVGWISGLGMPHMPQGVTSFSKKVKKGLGQHDQESGAVLFLGGGVWFLWWRGLLKVLSWEVDVTSFVI